MFIYYLLSINYSDLFAPDETVDDAGIALDYLDHLRTDVFVHVVGDGDAVLPVAAQLNGGIHSLKEGFLIDAGDDEIAFVEGFGTLGGGADADGREGMTDGGEERGLFG